MTKTRRFTLGEEIANTVSHGAGLVFGIVALILLIINAVNKGTAWHVVSFTLFGSTMVLLFLSSVLNHSFRSGSRAKDFFHNFDQIAIFTYIAGTYTPLALTVIRGHWGWTMFGIEWGFALTGILLKIFMPNKFEKGVNLFYISAFVIMGWLLLLFLIPLFRYMLPLGMVFIFIGGGCYTLGILFFKLKKLPYSHLIWHLFVLAGSVLHWIAIMFYIIPMK